MFREVATERNVSLLFSEVHDNDHCDGLFPVEDKEMLDFLAKFVFIEKLCRKYFIQIGTAFYY